MLEVSRLTLACFPGKELTVAGMDSFVEGSLDVRGAGQTLTSTAAFSNLRFSAKIQAQLESVSRDSLKQAEPLLEHFEISIGLGNVSAESDILAMVSQEALGALEVDQFQKLECLVACARGAAVGPEAPVALRRLRIDNMMIPVARMVGSHSIGDDLAAAMTQMLRATLHGYAAAIPHILQSSTIILHDALNDMVQQTLENVPPCQNTEVYFGPEGVVNISLLLTSLVLAVIGVVAWVHTERSDQGQFFNKSSLAACQAIPRGLSLGYPFFLVATMFLFLFSDLGLGTVINVIFQAGSERMKIGPAFSFSVLTLSRDSLRGGAWLLALLIVGLSGVWPFVKLALLLHVWLAPTTRPRRTKVLLFLDEYGKYSLVDSWLAILALCAFDIKWFGEEVSVQVTPVPMLPFFTFVIATVLSLVLGHIATESNRRSLQETAPPLRSSSRTISGNISESEPVHKSYDLCRELPRGRAVLLLGLTFLTGISIVCSASLQSLEYKVSGAISDLLLKGEERDLKYSLVGLGMFLTTGFQESGGLHAVQAIFFSFTLVIPLLLVCAVLALLLVPMTKAQHGLLWKVCHVLDAWAAFDVFVLAVTVANFEFWIFSNFLIYHDNIAAACGWVHDNLELECLAMECHVLPGFAVLAAAGIGSYAVPKMVLFSCEDLLDQAQAESESEEASELLSDVQLFAEPPRSFAFDGVLRESATQTEVFQLFGTGVAEFCLSGYNGSIYVYGQTGSGKTHTMQGEVESVQSMHNGEQRGLMCRILDYIFSEIGRRNQTGGTIQHSCKCSYLEIYKEQITDLLEPSSTNLQIREDINHGVYVERLSEHSVWSASDAFHVVWKGLHQRHVASTQMNELSSRSHSVFTLKVEASSTTAGGVTSTKIARLNLIDLAGSERQTFDPHNPSAHESIRVKEAGAINRSLSALTNVIMSLSHGRRKVSVAGQRQPFVRYRDSKLTFLLRDSLGGNSKTVIVACISPAAMCFGETLSTLKFASRAKHIRCAAVMNEEYSGTVGSLVLEVKSLRQQLDLLSSRGLAMEVSDLKTRSSPSRPRLDAQKLGREETSVEAALEEALQAGGSEDLRCLYGPRRIRRLEILLAAALDRERRCELRRHKVDKVSHSQKQHADLMSSVAHDPEPDQEDGVTDSCSSSSCLHASERFGEGSGRDCMWPVEHIAV
ncbi:KIF15 [Symbiodinium sp. CCMP2592]|nr:KIF15 [Symbiodinium sp. CCMP2592]